MFWERASKTVKILDFCLLLRYTVLDGRSLTTVFEPSGVNKRNLLQQVLFVCWYWWSRGRSLMVKMSVLTPGDTGSIPVGSTILGCKK